MVLKTNSQNQAFTLIELLVVIVIIGILSAISVAAFNSYQDKARLANARQFASQAHKLLLGEATKQGRSVTAYWKFDEGGGFSIVDSSGTGNHISSNDSGYNRYNWTEENPIHGGDAGVEIVAGMIVDGLPFSLLDAPEKDAFTYSVWIKPAGFDASETGNFMISNLSGMVSFGNYPDASVSFRANGGLARSAANVLKTDRWFHLLGTYDGQDVKLYLDGELVAETPYTIFSSVTVDTISYMALNNGADSYEGFLDEAIIYPVAFTGLD